MARLADNPFFARNIVTGYGGFYGRGLIEPVDDLRATNPATNDELPDELVKDFTAHNFDINYMIRTNYAIGYLSDIVQPLKENAGDDKYGSHYLIKRLPAEVLLDAYSEVTKESDNLLDLPAGTRALELPDAPSILIPATPSGQPPPQQTRKAKRTSVPTITQPPPHIIGTQLNNDRRVQ